MTSNELQTVNTQIAVVDAAESRQYFMGCFGKRSLAGRVYGLASDKQNPPVEAVVQYLFKNGYRRIEPVSKVIKLNSEQRYTELAQLCFAPSPDAQYLNSFRDGAYAELITRLCHSAQFGIRSNRPELERFCQQNGLDLALLDLSPEDAASSTYAGKPTVPLVAEGVKEGLSVHPSVLSLDVFIREGRDKSELFAFTERAAPKGLALEYKCFEERQNSLGNIGGHIASLIAGEGAILNNVARKLANSHYVGEYRGNLYLAAGSFVVGVVGLFVNTAFSLGLVTGTAVLALIRNNFIDRRSANLTKRLSALNIQALSNYHALHQLEFGIRDVPKSIPLQLD